MGAEGNQTTASTMAGRQTTTHNCYEAVTGMLVVGRGSGQVLKVGRSRQSGALGFVFVVGQGRVVHWGLCLL